MWMMADRANMKLPPELLERYNKVRGGTTQAAFLRELLEMYEERTAASTDEVREIVREELRQDENDRIHAIAQATADEVEERLR